MTPTVPLGRVSDEIAARLAELGADVSDLYRALGNHPPLLEAWLDFAWSLRDDAGTPRSTRELMILRSAQLQRAGYQWHDHVTIARAAGVDEGQIAAVEDWRRSTLFDEPTRVALALVEEVTAGEVSDETLGFLAGLFSPAERVELILTAAFYSMAPRVVTALRLSHPEEA
jgi:4-carboxymuconolactone decarboxylase